MLIYLKELKVTKCDLAILSGENSEHESFCKTDKNSQMSKKKKWLSWEFFGEKLGYLRF